MRSLSIVVLRIAGTLVFVAGILHLVMTGHLMHWFGPMTIGPQADVARAAMLLNHLVVGVLLLPLGIGLAAIAQPLERREFWAIAIGIADSIALLALPLVLKVATSGPMLEAPAFVTAALMLTVASVAVTVAVLFLSLTRPSAKPR
jgi:hypothetical protein